MQFSFDNCVLDLDRRELLRASSAVATAPKVFDVLAYLMEHRDRVVSRDDLVNAVWQGRIVSESTLATHINAVRKAVGDDGQQQRVIRTVARKGFRFVAAVTSEQAPQAASLPTASASASQPVMHATPAEVSASAPAVLAKPSIAVLPFVNLSGDPEQDYLSDGVIEDIISALSQYRWLFVVARNSSFAYKGHGVDAKQVGRELGVRYVLEGSWRKSANRVRTSAQLIDATTGILHWAGRFEGVLGDIFELQDQITESVVGAIAPQLERAEIDRAQRKPTGNLDAYDYYLRGMTKLHQGTRESVDQALQLFHTAIATDPDYASAYAMAAWCHCWRRVNNWMTDVGKETAEGIRLGRKAVDLGPDDAVALTRGGHALGQLGGDTSGAIALLDKALSLNPNLAAAWFLGAFLRLWRGEVEDAVEFLKHAMRLSPRDPELYRMQAGMATAHLFLKDFDAAASWAEKAYQNLPSFQMAVAIGAASHALAGRTTDAQRGLQNLRQLNPSLRLSTLAEWVPVCAPQHLATLTEGLRAAGLPQ
ncbi:winged helix-turn-helix domain-containing tetratricopeptide repeat protein [Achromobacter aegrifaciens]|uniref:winged helix-turn-helix domain-containing tetratricopeptide repeat protein n=1 Tax=Achromobacter aegrifaciens TaxID=1287736 RepID=UPI0028AAA2D3|nr:winged helix-turn-helix domain-containing tetratricopeptide repeat protein [Achromobacter aegrifaciens]